MGLPRNWLRVGDYRACHNYRMHSCNGMPLGPCLSFFYKVMSARVCFVSAFVILASWGKLSTPPANSQKGQYHFIFLNTLPPPSFLSPWKYENVTLNYTPWTSDGFEQIKNSMPGSCLSTHLLNLHPKTSPMIFNTENAASFSCCC